MFIGHKILVKKHLIAFIFDVRHFYGTLFKFHLVIFPLNVLCCGLDESKPGQPWLENSLLFT